MLKWTENVVQRLVGVELGALGLLFEHWSAPAVVARREDEWDGRLLLARQAMMQGMKTGKKEVGLPRELVADEYAVVLEAVRQVTQQGCPVEDPAGRVAWLRKQRVTYELAGLACEPVVFTRPFPCPETSSRPMRRRNKKKPVTGKEEKKDAKKTQEREPELEVFLAGSLDWSRKEGPLARAVVRGRLRVSDAKVKATLKRVEENGRRYVASQGQCLLASVFLDLASDGDLDHGDELQAAVLDALYLSGYHVLALAYLTQVAHSLTCGPVYLGEYDEDEVLKLCRAVRPPGKRGKPGPFARRLA